jgi:YVTN family beta-propeller protein
VSVINGQTETVSATIQVGFYPAGVAVNPDTNTIYVANVGTGVEGEGKWGTVSVINGQTETVSATLSLGKSQPDAVAVNPDTNTIYAAVFYPRKVTVINAQTYGITAGIRLSYGPTAVAVNPDTNTIYATAGPIPPTPNQGTDGVSVINGRTDKVTATIAAGEGEVTINPDTNTIFATNESSNTVSVANGRTNKVTATTKVGSSPDGVAVNPATRRIYVANFSSGTVSVITPQP